MSIILNPGSGPVGGATEQHARDNALVFTVDLLVTRGVESSVTSDFVDQGDGRWAFVLQVGETRHEVEMPGLPLEEVRYLGTEDQNIWDFPRLYVDGSSWVWKFAINQCGPTDDA